MPSSGMTCRTSWTIRCGVGGKRPSVARSVIRDKSLAQGSQRGCRLQLALKPFGQQRQTGTDIAHQFGVREVDLFDIGRRIADVDHLRPVRPHQERRLLDRVVTDRDDQVGPVDRLVDVIPLREGCCAHIEIMAAGYGALAHLRVEEGDLGAGDEIGQSGAQARAAGGGAQHHQRPLRLEDHFGREVESRRRRYRLLDRMRRHHGKIRSFLARDIFRQFQVNRPRPLLHRHAESVAHEGGDGTRAHDLAGRLGQRPHRRDHVDDLEAGLPAAHDPLLARHQDHRHCAEIRVGGTGHEVQRAGTERGDAHPGPPGQAPVGRRHERRRLLVPREDKRDARFAQKLDNIEVLLAGDAEDEIDALVFKRRDQQVRSFGHDPSLPTETLDRKGNLELLDRFGRRSAKVKAIPPLFCCLARKWLIFLQGFQVASDEAALASRCQSLRSCTIDISST